MTTSTATPSTGSVERRISTNGKKYRLEFRVPNRTDWVYYEIIYNTFEDAKDSMERMNKSDNELGGEWNVVDGAS